jgi:hypothetical protein
MLRGLRRPVILGRNSGYQAGVIFALAAVTLAASGTIAFAYHCKQSWDPVCAVKDEEQKTYSNAQRAKNAGAAVIAKGSCKRR